MKILFLYSREYFYLMKKLICQPIWKKQCPGTIEQ